MRVRPCVETDRPTILDIGRASFLTQWEYSVFLQELDSPTVRFLVAEQAGHIVGYVCAWLVADEVQIMNVAVHPCHRRQGVARCLLSALFEEARQRGARTANLEVRRTNQAAHALYRHFGFSQVAVRRRYYQNGEDALIMMCDLCPETNKPESP